MISRQINRMRLYRNQEHLANVRRSRRLLKKLRSFNGPARDAKTFAYIRQIDPTGFEELILSALEQRGRFVLRNKCYTGDGGLDGRVLVPPFGWIPIQVKRYSKHVSHAHVHAFGELIETSGYRAGLFIHCGRSGKAVYSDVRGRPLLLISGEKLLQLLFDGTLDLTPVLRQRRGKPPFDTGS